ncbi:MAG: hypothetical protein HY705_01710 [Gemmatimonadetes bacterium]|nr:hypothetical protein [Gemmatimonadota bacterium]
MRSARPPHPTVLYTESRGKPHIVATSTAAERRGVTCGMALAEAKALASDLVALPWDDETVARAALEVTTALLAASPRAAWERRADAQGVWWVDAAGLGSETELARKLAAIAHEPGYGSARVGIADSAIAAYAATQGGGRRGRAGGSPRRALTGRSPASPRPDERKAAAIVVPAGTDAAFLAPFPLALLDLDDDLADTLAALGLRTLGQLAALEPDEVEARFGPEGLATHRLARGLDPRGPTTPRDDALPLIEVELGSPVATTEPLLFVLKGALASLGDALRGRGLAVRELALALHLDDGSIAERSVRPARPTSHADALMGHCRAALENWRLPEPVTGLALRAAVTAPASGEQGDLFTPRWADPAALAAAFDRIRGSEGDDAVAVPQLRDGHLPEDGGGWQAVLRPAAGEDEPGARRGEHLRGAARRASGRPSARPPSAAERKAAAALRLLQVPAPIRVRLGRSGLEAFRYQGVWHDVTGWSGPERLAPKWWDSAADLAPRDYYSARTTDGALWLLFRDAVSRRWCVGGWWD